MSGYFPGITRRPGASGGGGAAAPPNVSGGGSFEATFTQVDVVLDQYSVVHSLGSRPSAIAVYDDNGFTVMNSGWTSPTLNSVSIDLASFTPITGTWSISISN